MKSALKYHTLRLEPLKLGQKPCYFLRQLKNASEESLEVLLRNVSSSSYPGHFYCLADVSTASVLDWFLSSKVATYHDDIKEDFLLNSNSFCSNFVALHTLFFKLWQSDFFFLKKIVN